MSDRIKDLLGEVADGVEPGDRLDAIRAATADDGRRTGRGWWAAGGVGLIAASVVTALALSTGGTPQGNDPEPAGPAPTTPTGAPTTITDGPLPGDVAGEVPVYFIGDTPNGPRLYREDRYVDVGYGESTLAGVIGVALGRSRDGSPRPPLDPDYRVVWPADTFGTAALDKETGEIGITVGSTNGDSASLRERGDLSAEEASLAVEALIRTAQGVVDREAPVRFYLDGEITDQILGVPTSEPLAAGPDLDVLAHVSLEYPSEGRLVDNDAPFTVRGLGNSFEGNIVTRIQRWEGTAVVAEVPTIAGWMDDRLFPFEVTFDLTDVPPGEYVVISRTDDPSGAGNFDTDTRRITLVD
ncbi:Gmad2 immunoglobulin-like domain-containing protein [Nocardioides zhouii]|uniref:Bacterial spore germination immunoglobulin-like domain-containing protein n=1 Tax=Nocardioides zhouii TaxID=1168729 RepID=A0A4Q2T6W9_9ACTN|nr:Gmad2 immunoglobulin-like domain-containing protein [Nocardioides zhouii]RYC14626.1 hypothetical protein EUA94_00435 [Nocardioides zhouii]